MAKAKQELTNRHVQGPPPSSDALDRIIAIAAEVAGRCGLLDEQVVDLTSGDHARSNAERNAPVDKKRSA